MNELLCFEPYLQSKLSLDEQLLQVTGLTYRGTRLSVITPRTMSHQTMYWYVSREHETKVLQLTLIHNIDIKELN